MATAQELAQSVNDLTRQELRKLNNYLQGGVSECELGGGIDIQNLASDVNALVGADKDVFKNELSALSGGIKDKHWPC